MRQALLELLQYDMGSIGVVMQALHAPCSTTIGYPERGPIALRNLGERDTNRRPRGSLIMAGRYWHFPQSASSLIRKVRPRRQLVSRGAVRPRLGAPLRQMVTLEPTRKSTSAQPCLPNSRLPRSCLHLCLSLI